jgi:glycosyltransferase involved in cell wall biosynthesis
VIFPPVDIERFQQSTINNQQSNPRSGFITAGRLATMKRVDLIVDACTELNVPLKVVGRGPDYDNLVKRGGPTVTFHNQVSDEEMPAYLSSAKAFVFASFEDFGITPIEAMATGTPVIAYEAGGALDYVVPGKTGAFFPTQTVASLKQALQEFDPSKYSQNDIKTAAERYSIQNFHRSMQVFLDKVIQ